MSSIPTGISISCLLHEPYLHIVVSLSGLYLPPIDQLTEQGYDAQFGVNVVGHVYFTQLLLPVLLAGAQSSADKKARVVNTSSITSTTVHGIDFNTLKDSPARQKLGLSTLYSQSKLVNCSTIFLSVACS